MLENLVSCFVAPMAIFCGNVFFVWLYYLIIPALLPFVALSFVPALKRLLFKKQSAIYWLLGGVLSYALLGALNFVLVQGVQGHLVVENITRRFGISDNIVIMQLYALALTLYFWLYLCVFKFLNDDDKVNQSALTRKEKILLLCLNALFSVGFMLAFVVVVKLYFGTD